MTYFGQDSFGGMAPKLAPRRLPHGFAQVAQNVELWSKELRPIRTPRRILQLGSTGYKALYRLRDTYLRWKHPVFVAPTPREDDDSGRVYYAGHYNPKWTDHALATGGSGDPPHAFWRLGLPQPDTAPTVALQGAGSSGVAYSAAWRYTFVTADGEESAPSPATTFTVANDDAVVRVSAMDGAPPNSVSIAGIVFASGIATIETSAPHFMTRTEEWWTFDALGGAPPELEGQTLLAKRIDATHFSVEIASLTGYTTGGTALREAPVQVTGMRRYVYRTDANGVYRLVGDIAIGDAHLDDDLGALLSTIAGETDGWLAAPGDLVKIISLPNGLLAGFRRNELWLSEPGHPHAWPIAYVKHATADIVDIEAAANDIIVGTKGRPERWTGRHPAAASMAAMRYEQSCVATGMVRVQDTVLYPSNDGLVAAAGGPPRLATEALVRRDEWQRYNPSSMRGCVYDDRFYGFYSGAGDNGEEHGCVVFDPSDPSTAFTLLTVRALACASDLEHDAIYFISDFEGLETIYELDAGPIYDQFFYRSRIEVLPSPINPKFAKVRFTSLSPLSESERLAAIAADVSALQSDYLTGAEVRTGSMGDAPLTDFEVTGDPYSAIWHRYREAGSALVFRLFARKMPTPGGAPGDFELVHEELVQNERAFTLPQGYLAEEFFVEIVGYRVFVHSYIVSDSMADLRVTR